MLSTAKQGLTQQRLFPLAQELSEAGHLILALKTISFATRTDIILSRRAKATARFERKLLKLEVESFLLEAATCEALHIHED